MNFGKAIVLKYRKEIILRILKKTKGILSKSESWFKGNIATNNSGMVIDPRSEEACRWCLSGAIMRATYVVQYQDPRRLYLDSSDVQHLVMEEINRGKGLRFYEYRLISSWNDDKETTHADVIHLLDRTINSIEKMTE